MSNAVKHDMDEVNALIKRVEYAVSHDLTVSSDDLKVLLELVLGSNARLNRQKSTIDKLRKLAGLVNSAEPGNRKKRQGPRQRNNESGFATGDAPETEHTVEKHALEAHQKGDQCPECDKGKLNKTEPASSLRVTGQAPLKVTRHILEQLRCNTCGAYFTAELPADILKDGARSQQYGYSARAIMAIHKNLTGVPYFRQQSLQQVLGMAVAASTIYDQCKAVADVLKPLVVFLLKLAANAPEYALDDTTNRIIDQTGKELPDRRTKKLKHRTGIYTSAVVATLEEGQSVVMFKTNIGHAGEWLDEILQSRQATASPPLLMSDALNRNQPSVIEHFIWCKCNAHARREFYHCIDEVAQADWVIEEYAKIWQNNTHCDDEGLDVDARQRYHHKHSLPVMESIREKCLEWIEKTDEIEPNSAFGKACSYFLNHFKDLSWFCHIPSAKIDNNGVERILKLIIRVRKNSLFYKTQNGADVGDILTTVLATAVANNVNVFEYLVALQQNWFDVGRNPENWLPWNYLQTLQSLSEENSAAVV